MTSEQQVNNIATVSDTNHYLLYLIILGIVLFAFIYLYKKFKDKQLLDNSVKLDDIINVDENNDRKTIEEAIKNKDNEFLNEALSSPIISNKNKKIIQKYFDSL